MVVELGLLVLLEQQILAEAEAEAHMTGQGMVTMVVMVVQE
jgi:hypothetical protein